MKTCEKPQSSHFKQEQSYLNHNNFTKLYLSSYAKAIYNVETWILLNTYALKLLWNVRYWKLKTEQANGTRCLLMCPSSTLRPQILSCELWANQRARSAWRHTHTHASTHDRIMHWNTHDKHFIYEYISLYRNSIDMTLIHMNIEISINHLEHLIIVYAFN